MVQIRDGLNILLKYAPEGSEGAFSAEHDQVFVGVAMASPDKVSDEDKKALYKLGWWWNEQYESWQHFT